MSTHQARGIVYTLAVIQGGGVNETKQSRYKQVAQFAVYVHACLFPEPSYKPRLRVPYKNHCSSGGFNTD